MWWIKNIGPGPLVAAAFIGPGTVTVCTLAGVHHGFTLLWAMALSILATIVLQEMAARLGLVSQKGLSELLRSEIKQPIPKFLSIVLIISAIVVGNAAYEAGNISGGVLGLEAIVDKRVLPIGNFNLNLLSVAIGAIAFALLFLGSYKSIEKVMVSLVILMSLSFVTAAVLTSPNVLELIKGIFTPSIPKDGLLTVVALIGTTVVPYNIFLHASLVKEKWSSERDIKAARIDTYVAIVFGGLISMAIIVAAAAVNTTDVANAADLASGLEPLYGSVSKYVLAVGLFAAGITSAITAPLAAAYVATGCLGWSTDLKSFKFRMVWGMILLIGVLVSSLNLRPIEIITFAQVANALLLPIIAMALIWMVNKPSVLGDYRNNWKQNVLGGLVVAIAILLGIKSLYQVFFG